MKNDIIRQTNALKAGRAKRFWDRHAIAHLGNQEKIYGSLVRLMAGGNGNISNKNLEFHGVPKQMISNIERGNAKLEIQFDPSGQVNLSEGVLLYEDAAGNESKKRLSEEELAKILLSLNQIAAMQMLRRTACLLHNNQLKS